MNAAICPGSFDPITLGHLDIIERASKIFDKVIVVVMVNPKKKGMTTFTAEERAELIKKSTAHLDNVEVDIYNGLLAEYAKTKGITTVIKGLRAISDFENEFQQALTNKIINKDLDTLFMTAGADHMFFSSSAVRQVCELGGDISSFVPKEIINDIVERLRKED